MTIHMADSNCFMHYLCGPPHDCTNELYDDWTFIEEDVTCEECLKILNQGV